jgi:hypothetical protein
VKGEHAGSSCNGKDSYQAVGQNPNELDGGETSHTRPVELPANLETVELPASRAV